jgi:hypothetical protein
MALGILGQPIACFDSRDFFRIPRNDGQAKNLDTKSERLTVSYRITWAWSERMTLYR